jgi:carbonic anhydrase
MSCPNATAPINIDLANVSGKCDLKCDYKFSYSTSSCVATNRGNYIALSYDNQTSNPVLYNSTGYNVQEIRIYTPSLHSYSGSKTDGELIVVHNSATGSKPLLVCIPIKVSNSNSISATLFKTVVNAMSSGAPSDGESATVNVDNYNLNNLVPRKPYFSYTASEPYQPCSTTVDYIVFGPFVSTLDIDSETLKTMQKLIELNEYGVKSGAKLFYNEKGPGRGTTDNDEIYIDCQPVGASDKSEAVITDYGTGYSYSTDDILNSTFFQIIIGILVFSLLFYILTIILAALNGKKTGGNALMSSMPNKIM